MKKQLWITNLLFAALLVGCSSDDKIASDENDETAQQVGETMAAIDETGGSDGEIALQHSIEKTFRKYAPRELRKSSLKDFVIPKAYAASCLSASTFGACEELDPTTFSITHTFDDCTLGLATFKGDVTLIWEGDGVTTCELGLDGDSITRIPDFTVTGLRGAKLTVAKVGSFGQRLQLIGGVGVNREFEFRNDGIQRVFETNTGTKLLDFTSSVTDPILITGTTRSNRVVDGGILKVVNNLTDVSCELEPSNVEWSSTCNCAVSGEWTGSCSNGKSFKVDITECGKATVTSGGETADVEFDRCVGI
jgi:nitrous oxide reductase accessory protein NosL